MRRCPHGVYWPEGHEKALCCQMCNPDGNGDVPTPVLPTSSGTALNLNQTDDLQFCPCGAIALSTRTECNICFKTYPAGIGGARHQGTANAKQPGVCPDCGSAVHYTSKTPGMWTCADCEKEFPGPRGRA